MVNKPPKPAKAPKANKRAAAKAASNPFMSSFSEDSLFGRSQKFVKETDAKPFRDFGYVVLAVLTFCIWRLSAAVQSGHGGANSIWSFFVFGLIAILNIWTYFLVLIRAKRGGDIGIVTILDEDVIRFMWMSGLFGAWAAILWFRYRPTETAFFRKAFTSTLFNVFWVAIYVKFYL
ncbi:hypothetical protein EMPS_10814 [Entomortierella parvispora]|uniref:Uncharacterized protein n=1 Tax=Entomortierella parvispora TaxID=205924 RepID=A0A9P3HKW2_9FUNG|nr:hypothetical protein EMPS_10814 [Entomortierella parvispora]